MTLDKPEVHAGDRWSYRQTDAFTNEVTAEFTRRVIDVSDAEITTVQEIKGRTGKKTIWYDRNWNLVDDGDAQYAPALDLMEFPVTVGDTWKHQYKGTMLKSGATGVCYVTGKFLGQETVTAPAGTFEAGKIETNVECRGADADASVTKFGNVQWLVPALGRAVRAENTTIANGRVRSKSIVELIDYHQAQPDVARPAEPDAK